jgi:cobalt-zinc-cadmium efflux system outer membrane protein
MALEAAGRRAKWERSRIFALSAILDANAEGQSGFEAGPGIQVEIPLLNRNKGAITRAEADIERAARRYVAVRHRIFLEVTESYNQLRQASQSLESWRNELLPRIEEEVNISRRSYADGEEPYLFVLETSRKLADARMGEAEADAGVRRAIAQLERAVGRRLN